MKTTGKLILTFFYLFEIESNLMNGCPLIFLLNLLLEYFRCQIKYSLKLVCNLYQWYWTWKWWKISAWNQINRKKMKYIWSLYDELKESKNSLDSTESHQNILDSTKSWRRLWKMSEQKPSFIDMIPILQPTTKQLK